MHRPQSRPAALRWTGSATVSLTSSANSIVGPQSWCFGWTNPRGQGSNTVVWRKAHGFWMTTITVRKCSRVHVCFGCFVCFKVGPWFNSSNQLVCSKFRFNDPFFLVPVILIHWLLQYYMKYKDEVGLLFKNIITLWADTPGRGILFLYLFHYGTLLVTQSRVRAGIHLLLPSSAGMNCHSSVILHRKAASNKQIVHPFCQATLSIHLSFSPLIIQSIPFPLHGKDSAKATAIVFKLFILSQDCVVIYTVNNENTL